MEAMNNLHHYFRHYTNRQGLSHNTVFCSLQDSRGFMWFGTEDGLNHFDGYNFTTYRYNSHLPAEQGLPGDRINALFEDSSGKIWMCTQAGVCYYDYTSHMFYPLQFIPGEDCKEVFFAIGEDNNKQLWFVNHSRIVRFSPGNKEIRYYPAEDYFHPNAMTILENGVPFFTANGQLYLYRQDTERFTCFNALTETELERDTHITTMYPVAGVGVLLGTNNAGLKIFYWQSQQIETIIPDIQVRSIEAYTNNTFWIGSESGVYIHNLIDRSTTHLTRSFTNEYSIADNAVYSITKDQEGGVWVGSFFGGISYLPQQYTPFDYFIAGKTHPTMQGNAVREICPDDYGHIWLGTEDYGINRYTPATGEIVNFSPNSSTNKLSAINIHGLLANGDKLWIGTFHRGIEILDIPSGKVVKHYTHANTGQQLGSDFILCFHKTDSGDILIGTGRGVVKYELKNERFTPWQPAISTLVRQIFKDSKGLVWIVSDNGLYRYHPGVKQLLHYPASTTSTGLGSNSITSVFEDSLGRIWVTTTYGFSLYNEATDSFSRITTENGLPSNIIYRIVEDNDANFWVTTANGLVRYTPKNGQMQIFSSFDGLHETQFNYSSSYKTPDGRIYLGTVNGMISFDPRLFRTDSYIPPVYITRISHPGETKEKIKTENIFGENTGKGKLTLPYHNSSFTISYTALNYTSPEALRYAYMLEGVDKEWIDMGSNREVTFANLSPGSYLFRVRSTNSSDIWQDNECVMEIIITPPFWKTRWALFVYILVVLGIIFLFYDIKNKKIEERHLLAKKEFENEKEKELYNAKIQFFTFITHEIRTPLTLIKAPLEKIIRSGDGSPSTRSNLHTIAKNTQRLLDLSNQLLDFRKTESRGFRLNYVKTDIKLWTDAIVHPFIAGFEQEEKTIRVIYPEHLFVAYIDREAYSKIISNLLNNALKYSQKDVVLEVLGPVEEDRRFVVQVTNDGVVIPDSEKEAIFEPFYRLKETENIQGSGIGLSLSRSLAEFHTGSLVYQQTEDGLNRFILTLPIFQTDYCFGEEENDDNEITPQTTPSPTVKPTILVVEDQKDMRQFIVDELAGSYQVLEAFDGKAALEQLESNSVNLIISDVMMPVMDGFELCNRVKNNVHFSHIPFIILTAQHNLQSRLEGLNHGADAYMEKPFSMELLLAQVENLLKSRELLSKSYQEKPLTPTETLAVSPLDDIFLNKFNSYLEENLTNDSLNVESIAAEMGMSTSSLYRKVKGLSGLSPNDFIRIVRLKKAVELMREGETRINEVAFKVGFSSPAYFSTCFQKQYGKSPTEFLKNA